MKRVCDEGYPKFSLYESVIADKSRPGHFTRSIAAHTLTETSSSDKFAMTTHDDKVIRVCNSWMKVWDLSHVVHCGSVTIPPITYGSDRQVSAICHRDKKYYMAYSHFVAIWDSASMMRDDERKFDLSLGVGATPISIAASDSHLFIHEGRGESKALTVLDRNNRFGLSELSGKVNGTSRGQIDAFAVSGNQLVVATGDRSLSLWSQRDEALSTIIQDAHAKPVTKLQEHSGQLVSASTDGKVKFWDLRTLREPVSTVDFGDPVLDVEVVNGGIFAKTSCTAGKQHIKVRGIDRSAEVVNLTFDQVRQMAVMVDKLVIHTDTALFCFPFHV